MFRSDTNAEIFLRDNKIQDKAISVNGVYDVISGHTISTVLEKYENEIKAKLFAEFKTAYEELVQHSYDADNFNRVVDFSDVTFEFKKFIKMDTEL